ncbi:hypothetical protein BSL78_14211 [Apostichopus japonicus]|uniref:Uncharacterized protein n=1 Tax=Stichopus japonicus TaxID=307972 RepID=A0A2G8KLM0_STIJA|nr:hypothetical protein BSL78_14211 [Apostichopus japonicus]
MDEVDSESCADLSSEKSVHNLNYSVPFKTTDVKPADLAQRIVGEVRSTPSDEEVTPETDPEWCPDAANNASVYKRDQCSEDAMHNSSSSSNDTSCNKTLKEELLESCIAKGMRRQFISDRYLEALVNLHKTKAELRARKPEPRVKIEKPVHLDTDLMYSVRQSLKRSLPKVAGKNNLSALMMMADGMFQEMSLDRGLDELAWPYDPLAELRESGLALVDYMEPTSPPNNSIEHVRNISQQEETPPTVQDATVEISVTPRMSELTASNLDSEEGNKEESSALTDMLIPSILSTNVQGPTVETSVSDIRETFSEESSCENVNVIDHTTDDTGSGFVACTSDGLDELQQADVISPGPMEQYPLTWDLKFEETPSEHIRENQLLQQYLLDIHHKQPTISAFTQDVSVSSAVHLFEKIAVEEKSSALIPAANLDNEQMQQDRDVQKAILHFEGINKVSKVQLQPELNQYFLIPAAKANNEKIPEHGDTKETILRYKRSTKQSEQRTTST